MFDAGGGAGIIKYRLFPAWHAADLEIYKHHSCFKVVSSHEKVINLQVEGWHNLLFIADSSLEAGPATIALEDADFAFFSLYLAKHHKGGLFTGNCLLIPYGNEELTLNWREGAVETFSPVFFKTIDSNLIRKSLEEYRLMLAKIHLSSPASVLLKLQGGDGYFRQQIANSYPLMVEALLSHSRQALIKFSRNLIGMGRGLTPTGDDLLHGALVAYHHFDGDKAFLEAVKDDLDAAAAKTNIFGRHVLEMGYKGLTPEIFGALLSTVARGEADQRLLKRISAIGSSSGLDIAIAILFFIEKFLQIRNNY